MICSPVLPAIVVYRLAERSCGALSGRLVSTILLRPRHWNAGRERKVPTYRYQWRNHCLLPTTKTYLAKTVLLRRRLRRRRCGRAMR